MCIRDRRVVAAIINEAFTPLRDRIINLALPHRDRRDSKYLRLKIIIAVLQLIIETEPVSYTHLDVYKRQRKKILDYRREESDMVCGMFIDLLTKEQDIAEGGERFS